VSAAWRAVAVDDEPPALKRIRSLLAGFDEVELAAAYSDPAEALRAVRARPPDLLFLDIQMPGMSGLDFAAALGEPMPLVVFVTAFDEHALRAFELHALDYLLKPIERDRFRLTMERVLRRLESNTAGELVPRLRALLATVEGRGGAAPARLSLRSGEGFVVVDPAEIDRVAVDGNTIRVFVGRESYAFRDTLAAFEARLPPRGFVRVHRSLLVNVERIRRVEPWFNGDLVLTLSDGTQVVTGRTYREQVRRALGL
jgi:two-component system, LytTR family, response regulator